MPQTRSPAPSAAASAVAAAVAANINPALAGNPVDVAAAQQQLMNLGHMDSAQILALLRHLPGVFNKLSDTALKDATAAQLMAANVPGGPDGPPPPLNQGHDSPIADDPNDADYLDQNDMQVSPGGKSGGRSRRPETGTDEWIRMRKDNHKEVERRRRSNINDGINELSRIVPNGAGEKVAAKGAILSRAVQYIHQLKDNEARNIEKWTLEKLLMDQAMGDLQAQLQEMTKMWEEEVATREKLQQEVAGLKQELQILQEEGQKDGDGPSKKRARGE